MPRSWVKGPCWHPAPPTGGCSPREGALHPWERDPRAPLCSWGTAPVPPALGLQSGAKPTWPRENELFLGVCFLMAGEHHVQGQADSPYLQLAKQASFFPIFFSPLLLFRSPDLLGLGSRCNAKPCYPPLSPKSCDGTEMSTLLIGKLSSRMQPAPPLTPLEPYMLLIPFFRELRTC